MTTRRQRLVIAVILVACVVFALVSLSRDDGDGRSPVAAEPSGTPSGGPSPSPTTAPTEPGGIVSGTVTGTDGAPLPGVEVTVLTAPFEAWSTGPGKPTMPPGPTWTGTTDDEGRYRVEQVTPGPHRVVFSTEGRGPAAHARLYNGGAQALDEAPDVLVSVAGETRVDAVLPAAARLSGTVRNARGQAVPPGTPVLVLRRDRPSGTGVATTATRPGGRYSVDALAPGAYVLRVDDSTSGQIYHPATTRPRAARTVQLDEGERVTDVDVVLPGPGTLFGRALRPDGAPLGGVWVTISSGLRSFGSYGNALVAPERVQTDAAGRYQFSKPTGRHEVSLELEDPPHPCVGVHVQPVSVWVIGGRRTVQDLRMEAPVSIRGRVTDKAGRPLRGIEVTSEQRLSCQVTARTDRDGRYTLTGLSPGGHRVRFGSAEYNDKYFTAYYGGGGPRDAPVLHVDPGSEAVGIDARLTLGGRITGKVTVPGGARALSVDVTATSEPGAGTKRWVEASATVAPDGRYVIVGLPTGAYRLSLWPSYTAGRDQVEGLHYTGGGTSVDPDDASEVEVNQGRATTRVDLVLDLGATIRGRAIDGDGAPRPGIQVVAYREDADSDTDWPESETGWSEASSTWTDASGRYVLRGLAAGAYRIGFAGGHEFFPEVAEIDAAQDVEVASGEAVRRIDAALVFDWD